MSGFRLLTVLLAGSIMCGCKTGSPNKLLAVQSNDAARTDSFMLKPFVPSAWDDSTLLTEFLDYNNAEAESNGDNYYNATVFYPSDSSFRVINLFREFSGATYTSVAESYVVKNKTVQPTNTEEGEVFRIDRLADNRYLFYVDQSFKMMSTVYFFEATFIRDSFVVKPTQQHRNYIFDFIQTKKETPEKLPTQLDFSRRFTRNEILALWMDTNKVGSDEYYFMADEEFLRTGLHNLSTVVYFKHSYGDELKKVLRVYGSDYGSIAGEVVLAMKGGDSNSYWLTSEFQNDSTFVQTLVNRETTKDEDSVTGYDYDSIVYTYRYDELLQFDLVAQDSIRYYREFVFVDREWRPTLTVNQSEPFRINSIDCYWKFYTTNTYDENGMQQPYSAFGMSLLGSKNQKAILTSNGDFLPNEAIDAYDLRLSDFKDVNFDGYKDFVLENRIGSGSGGTVYECYLFNRKTNAFKYDTLFSGGNLEIDTINKTISSHWKFGYGHRFRRTFHFDKAGNVKFEEYFEEELGDEDRMKRTYEKWVKGKRVEKKVTTDEESWEGY